jgi:hypothetical protein
VSARVRSAHDNGATERKLLKSERGQGDLARDLLGLPVPVLA